MFEPTGYPNLDKLVSENQISASQTKQSLLEARKFAQYQWAVFYELPRYLTPEVPIAEKLHLVQCVKKICDLLETVCTNLETTNDEELAINVANFRAEMVNLRATQCKLEASLAAELQTLLPF